MPFNANIPQPTDDISTSQADLLNNFIALGTMVNPNAGTVQLPQQAAAPAAPIATTLQFYSVDTPAAFPANPIVVAGGTEMFIQRFNGGNNINIPITASIMANPGWAYLTSGILLKWGTVALGAGPAGVTSIVFPVGAGIPPFTAVLSVNLTPLWAVAGDTSAVYIQGAWTNLQFDVIQEGAARNCTYLAIGY